MDVRASRQRRNTTTTGSPAWSSATARTGWVVLLVISVIGGLNHLLGVLAFATSADERLAFTMFAGVNAYATAVLLVEYRRHRRWAWYVTWLEVAAFSTVLPLAGGGIGLGYLVVAVVAGLAQLATLPEFWPEQSRQRQGRHGDR